MFARQVAFVCLLSVGALAASSERTAGGSTDIVVFIHYQTEPPATVSDAMWRESGSLMGLSGYRVRRLDAPHQVAAAFLVVVDLEGRCEGETTVAIRPVTNSLASTIVEDGHILPFIKMSCTALHWFLAPALGSKSDPQFFYGRALGRLLAHELYHVVGQTMDHTGMGVTQATVSVAELLSDRFTFAKAALAKLSPLPSNTHGKLETVLALE
jgi:hypothetical protein